MRGSFPLVWFATGITLERVATSVIESRSDPPRSSLKGETIAPSIVSPLTAIGQARDSQQSASSVEKKISATYPVSGIISSICRPLTSITASSSTSKGLTLSTVSP